MSAYGLVFRIFGLLFLALGLPGKSFASTLVPILNTETEGSRNNGIPFNGRWGTSQRYQQIWDSSLFGTDPLQINSISFRLDGTHGTEFELASFPGSLVYLSTSSLNSLTLGTDFAANHGADKTLIDWDITMSGIGGTGGPNPFGATLSLETPFVYDPSIGALLLEIILPVVPVTSQFDAIAGGRDGLSPIIGTSRLYAFDSNSPVGRFTPQYGLVAAFDVSSPESTAAVPLPAGLGLLGAATGMLALIGRRRKKKRVGSETRPAFRCDRRVNEITAGHIDL
jgi:hypothetical protein